MKADFLTDPLGLNGFANAPADAQVLAQYEIPIRVKNWWHGEKSIYASKSKLKRKTRHEDTGVIDDGTGCASLGLFTDEHSGTSRSDVI